MVIESALSDAQKSKQAFDSKTQTTRRIPDKRAGAIHSGSKDSCML